MAYQKVVYYRHDHDFANCLRAYYSANKNFMSVQAIYSRPSRALYYSFPLSLPQAGIISVIKLLKNHKKSSSLQLVGQPPNNYHNGLHESLTTLLIYKQNLIT